MKCEYQDEISTLKADMRNMKGWQKAQNGSLLRLEDHIRAVDRKIDALKMWLMGQLAAIIVGIILFLVRG